MSRRSTSRWLVLVFAISAFLFAAVPAIAHHPIVTGQINCNGLLSFTATAWEGVEGQPDTRHHNDIRIEAATSTDGVNWSAFSEIGTGTFTSGNGYTFNDTYQFTPVPEWVQLRARADGKWGPNDDINGDNALSPEPNPIMEVPLCPANPSAVAVTRCDLSGAKITLSNSGGESIQFTVLRNGTAEQPVTVAGGAQETRTYTMAEDTTATFLITAGEYSTSSTLTFDCLPAVAPSSAVLPAGAVAGDVLPATGPPDLAYLGVALLLVLAGRGVLSSERLGAGKRL